MSSSSSATPQDFETALAQLEHLVHQLEDGGLPLEDALKVFEQGVHLTRHCQQRLANAEQKVQQLMATHEGIHLQEFPQNPHG